MQRKRTVNSLLIVVGVAFGLSVSAGKVSAAEISVDDVVPVTIVDQAPPGHPPVEVDDGTFFEDDEPLGDEWIADEEPIDNEVDVEIGEAIAIERSADGSVTVPDLLVPDEGTQEDEGATEAVASELGGEPVVSTPSSLPATVNVAASEQSVETGPELVDTANLRPIVQRGESAGEQNQVVGPVSLALMMIVAGLLAHRNRFLFLGSRG
ncbi:MAG: hypothetical protein HYR89_11425 [Actinobacteria bacterium]|nr:hypothetical protein [Actinomycetota bacterium]